MKKGPWDKNKKEAYDEAYKKLGCTALTRNMESCKKISRAIKTRTPVQVYDHWNYKDKEIVTATEQGMKKGPWDKNEKEAYDEAYKKVGPITLTRTSEACRKISHAINHQDKDTSIIRKARFNDI